MQDCRMGRAKRYPSMACAERWVSLRSPFLRRAKERAHIEPRLIRGVAVLGADRAGAAALAHAIRAGGRRDMGFAGRHIIGARLEGAHGTGTEAGLVRTGVAW